MIATTVTAALSDLGAAISAAGTLQGASQSTLAPVLSAVDATLAAIDADAASIEASIDQTSVGGIHVGMAAPLMIATLVAQAQASTDLSTLHTTRGYVARVGANIVNAPG